MTIRIATPGDAGAIADIYARWSVDCTVYVRTENRRAGVGSKLYQALFRELTQLGYCEAFAGIALPNDATICG